MQIVQTYEMFEEYFVEKPYSFIIPVPASE